MAVKPISVSQLNRYIARVLGTDPILSGLSVSGEISGLTKHSSGHWYFDLKDKTSKVRCFLHAARALRLRFEIDAGMEVVVFGSINLYEPGGYYSLNVTDIQPMGEGALAAAFEKLRKKLEAEGLFDAAHKRPLPAFPSRIGVVTSPTGAAIRDIITTVTRRDPLADILLYPALVQGEGSAATVCEGIRVLNEKFPELDVIIIGRGGGSAEDLWTFNEESVARAVYASKIPVISAVGHEVDTVITDYVADVRAATPTAAAELAVPHVGNIKDRLTACAPGRMYDLLASRLELCASKTLRLKESADSAAVSMISELSSKLRLLKLDLDSSHPLGVLEKGYAAVKASDGSWRTRASQLKAGENVQLVFSDGTAEATVIKTKV
ncbi:MAG: exodeoxyribonuclease VII large subunit [Firmicutes bacterium]|nr:exodeoxyribonuclease VII large subunit [Bacillota bacterium]